METIIEISPSLSSLRQSVCLHSPRPTAGHSWGLPSFLPFRAANRASEGGKPAGAGGHWGRVNERTNDVLRHFANQPSRLIFPSLASSLHSSLGSSLGRRRPFSRRLQCELVPAGSQSVSRQADPNISLP